MNKNESPFGLKTGYSSKNKWNDELKKAKNRKVDGPATYPNGLIPTIIIAVSIIIGLGLALGLSPINIKDHSKFISNAWYNTVWYVLGIAMCLIAFWAIGRTDFLSSSRFAILKFSRVIKFDVLRRKIRHKVTHFAIDDVCTHDDFLDYLSKRKKNTKKIFYINLGIYSSIFIIWTIVMSILNAK